MLYWAPAGTQERSRHAQAARGLRQLSCRRIMAVMVPQSCGARKPSRSVCTIWSMDNRCAWARTEPEISYHDSEWGVPVHDDRLLFEFLILEGAQAGLSWSTILRKRQNYRRAFDNFDPAVVARYGHKKRQGLLADAGIVRNRLKIEAAIQNAKAF